jgi:hypothetical protein
MLFVMQRPFNCGPQRDAGLEITFLSIYVPLYLIAQVFKIAYLLPDWTSSFETNDSVVSGKPPKPISIFRASNIIIRGSEQKAPRCHVDTHGVQKKFTIHPIIYTIIYFYKVLNNIKIHVVAIEGFQNILSLSQSE